MMPGVILLLVIGAAIASGVWVYQDAKSRGLEAGLWTLLAVVVPNFLGVLIYFMVGRKSAVIYCDACHMRTEQGRPFCSHCGARLSVQQPQPNSGKQTLLIVSLLCIVLSFALVIGASVLNSFGGSSANWNSFSSLLKVERSMPQEWSMTLGYSYGTKTRTISMGKDNPNTLHIEADITGGTLELGVRVNDLEETRIPLHDIESVYIFQLQETPENGNVVLRLYADGAKGSFKIKW
jgi:hypothetical protein